MGKQDTLSVAIPMFIQRGFGPTTTRGVARAANITRCCLYRQFNTKDQLFDEAIAFAEKRFADDLRRVAQQPTRRLSASLQRLVTEHIDLFKLAAVHHPVRQWKALDGFLLRVERRARVWLPFLDGAKLKGALRSIALQASASAQPHSLVEGSLAPLFAAPSSTECPVGANDDVVVVEDLEIRLRLPRAQGSAFAAPQNASQDQSQTPRKRRPPNKGRRKRRQKRS